MTPQNYVLAAYRKICKIHSSLPPGHILVFLTGKEEILQLVKKLEATFPFVSLTRRNKRREEERDKDLRLNNCDSFGDREEERGGRKDSYVNLDE